MEAAPIVTRIFTAHDNQGTALSEITAEDGSDQQTLASLGIPNGALMMSTESAEFREIVEWQVDHYDDDDSSTEAGTELSSSEDEV